MKCLLQKWEKRDILFYCIYGYAKKGHLIFIYNSPIKQRLTTNNFRILKLKMAFMFTCMLIHDEHSYLPRPRGPMSMCNSIWHIYIHLNYFYFLMIHLWLKGILINANSISYCLVYRFVFYSIPHHPRLSARYSWIQNKDVNNQSSNLLLLMWNERYKMIRFRTV